VTDTQIADSKKADVAKALEGFRPGDQVKAKILSIDSATKKINFGIKASYFAEGADESADEDEDMEGEEDQEVQEDDDEASEGAEKEDDEDDENVIKLGEDSEDEDALGGLMGSDDEEEEEEEVEESGDEEEEDEDEEEDDIDVSYAAGSLLSAHTLTDRSMSMFLRHSSQARPSLLHPCHP
jgi:rRNA biogenesis protein RRP5